MRAVSAVILLVSRSLDSVTMVPTLNAIVYSSMIQSYGFQMR